MSPATPHNVLDRRLPVPGILGLITVLIAVYTVLTRILKLDVYLLGAREARWAFDSYSLYYGQPLPVGQSLPDSGPFVLVWNTIPFYLFGVSDASARAGSAILGIALVGLVFALRPFLTSAQLVSVAAILALSPTVLFASRTVEPGLPAAFLAMLVLVSLLRIGLPHTGLMWPTIHGAAIAALYGTGPLGVTTLLALGVGVLAASVHDLGAVTPRGAIGASVRSLGTNRRQQIAVAVGFVFTAFWLFTRGFSELSSLRGLWSTAEDWVRVMSGGTANIPGVFYFWALILYETFFVLLAIAGLLLSRKNETDDLPTVRHLSRPLFIGWFGAIFLLQTFASVRETSSTVLVALPMLLLAGIGLGHLIDLVRDRGLVWQAPLAALLIVTVLASAHTSFGLAYTRGDGGREPLAWDIPSPDARQLINRIYRLSHDVSTSKVTPIDPTGRFGLNIKVTPDQQWPFMWYFREFPFFSVALPAAYTDDTDIAIGSTADVMESVGLTPGTEIWLYKPADPLTRMRTLDILRTGLNPKNWGTAWDYMVNREGVDREDPRLIHVGYSVRLMNKMHVDVGPFNLFGASSPGPGSALGQLNAPAGIAVDDNGVIYVLNAGNQRVDRYDSNGIYLGIWSGQTDSQLALSWSGFQGGTGITAGPDGVIYIADTWNHVVIAMTPDGKVVRLLGARGQMTDITDRGQPSDSPGLFFGPRIVAAGADRIYITDTGNERVQVFAKDGTFLLAFGGFGQADGQFVEPTGIAIAPDGTVWVADSGNARLQQFDADGTWLATHQIPEWSGQEGVYRLNYLAFDEDGVLYATSPIGGVIAFHDGKIVQLENFSGIVAAGIAIDRDGNLLVVNASETTVIRARPQLPAGFGESVGTPAASPMATPRD